MNCQVGDLAVVVDAELPENIGKLVRVVQPGDWSIWSSFEDLIYVWVVESLSSECPLVYEHGLGNRSEARKGFVPDVFLRPIRPRPSRCSITGRALTPELSNV
jgi:hypothetical protein